MKKLVVLMAVLAIAVPSMAGTTVSCAQIGTTAQFTISYAYDGTGSVPRAFALDVTTNLGSFSAVAATMTGESTTVTKGFGIFPGTIAIDSTGSVTSVGTPVAPQTDLPSGTLAGLNTAGMTLELGSLYATSAAAPVVAGTASSGILVTVTMSGMAQDSAAKVATITIVPNTARGGLVLEDATSVGAFSSACTVTIPALPPSDCFSNSLSTFTRWTLSGKPDCWCPPTSVTGLPKGGSGYQCVGDADGTRYASTYRVYNGDISAISASWKKNIGASGYNTCADVDHAAYAGVYGVYNGDVSRVAAMWKKTDAQLNSILGMTSGVINYCGRATVPTSYK